MKRSLLVFNLLIAGFLPAITAAGWLFTLPSGRVVGEPAELPVQGLDRATGRVVIGLGSRDRADIAACGWREAIRLPSPAAGTSWTARGWAVSNSVWLVETGVVVQASASLNRAAFLAALDAKGKTATFSTWLSAHPSFALAWYQRGKLDPDAWADDLRALRLLCLMTQSAWDDLIEECCQ
jgi:hypothetical protein